MAASTWVFAQHTFSIVAVDTTTGEIGSAGATCLDDISFPGSGGAIIISDVLPDVGAVHTQASWIRANQNNANRLLNEGKSAVEIIDWVVKNDAQVNSTIRQYGAVTIKDSLSSASHTGVNCFNEKDHRTGVDHSIQGNILLNNGILDSMQKAFTSSAGLPLCDRLMMALQAANIPGADSRCLNEGVSSRSAFLRVARKGDDAGSLWLDLNVPSTGFGVEPIDSLAVLVSNFKKTLSQADHKRQDLQIYPNPSSGWINIVRSDKLNSEVLQVELLDGAGRLIKNWNIQAGMDHVELDALDGHYYIRVSRASDGEILLVENLMINNK